MERKKYSLDERKAIILKFDQLRTEGKTVTEIVKELNISDKTIYNWKKEEVPTQIKFYNAKEKVRRAYTKKEDIALLIEDLHRCVKTAYKIYANIIKK